jgi:sugar phosphate isomerase/epimerase
MFLPGITSITFRKFAPDKIVALTCQAGLSCIEWGGDVHVPHGNEKIARDVAKTTIDSGLLVSSYGSYYRVGESETAGLSFDAVLASACALGAPLIRVWAGKTSSAAADESYWKKVIADTHRIADAAQALGIKIVFEYHGQTLTDTIASATRLLQTTLHPAVATYWQPPNGMQDSQCIESIVSVMPYLSGLHVFHWVMNQGAIVRCPLIDGLDRWVSFISRIPQTQARMPALLEFVKDDSEDQFLADAKILVSLV